MQSESLNAKQRDAILELWGFPGGFPMPRDGGGTLDFSRWKAVQLAALTVVALCRRSDEPTERLWYFPTSLFEERQTLAPPGSIELAAKSVVLPTVTFRRFGNSSITVSWKALNAIATATGSRPVQAREVITDLGGFQSPDGMYGSKIWRKDGYTINDCARHTAMALLIQMSFGDDLGAVSIVRKFETPVRWLVTKAVLPDGGWSFEQSERSQNEGLGATSTVACLMALSRFVKLCRREQLQSSGLYEIIRANVGRSLSKLIASGEAGIWDLRNEGLPIETRVAESAYVISGIRYAIKEGALEDLAEGLNVRQALRTLQLELLSVGMPLERGWPAFAGGLSISLAATICALHALSDIPSAELSADERKFIQEAEKRVLSDLERKDGWEALRSWDWATLAELSAMKVRPLSTLEWESLLRRIAALKNAHTTGSVTSLQFRRLPWISRSAARFCLTRGDRIALKSSIFSSIVRSSIDFATKSSWSIWSAVISFIVGLLLAGAFR